MYPCIRTTGHVLIFSGNRERRMLKNLKSTTSEVLIFIRASVAIFPNKNIDIYMTKTFS
jgi:hypothetical protein